MNNMTVYLKDVVLNQHLTSKSVYIALYKNGVEISGMDYARQNATFTAPDAGQVTNSAEILFPIASGDWGNITHIAVVDSLTGGNQLFYGEAFYVKNITTSSQYTIPKNYLIVRLL